MADFVRHNPCPSCGSKDNLGEWEDHFWCFGCGHYERKGQPPLKDIEALIRMERRDNKYRYLELPNEFSFDLPEIAQSWLRKYGITKAEVQANSFGWSDTRQQLIFPVFDPAGNLLMYQGRYFGQALNKPRFSSQGVLEDVLHVLGPPGPRLVLVEDLISAIKVGRHTACSPLWGSSLSTKKIHRLANFYPYLTIWLDKDKAKTSVRYSMLAETYFEKVKTIISERDPKEYSDDVIQSFLANPA